MVGTALDNRYVNAGEDNSITAGMVGTALDSRYVNAGEAGSITADMVGTALDSRYVNAGEAGSITADMVGTALDSRYVNAGEAGSITATMVGTALDSRFVREGQTNSITTAMIQNSAVTRAKLHGSRLLYMVAVTNCSNSRGTVSFDPRCNAMQTNLGSCPSCAGNALNPNVARNCNGNCTCVNNNILTGTPNYPVCTNTALGYLVNE
jgi:hypothetical protein